MTGSGVGLGMVLVLALASLLMAGFFRSFVKAVKKRLATNLSVWGARW
jgi:hypothetical protein